MGGMLTAPETEKHREQGQGNGLRYGLSSMQGWRPEMEDTHHIKLGLGESLEDWSFFAVFDGHAGKCAAMSAALNLLDYIVDDNHSELKRPPQSEPQGSEDLFDDYVQFKDEDNKPPETNQNPASISLEKIAPSIGCNHEFINQSQQDKEPKIEIENTSIIAKGETSEQEQQIQSDYNSSQSKKENCQPETSNVSDSKAVYTVGMMEVDAKLETEHESRIENNDSPMADDRKQLSEQNKTTSTKIEIHSESNPENQASASIQESPKQPNENNTDQQTSDYSLTMSPASSSTKGANLDASDSCSQTNKKELNEPEKVSGTQQSDKKIKSKFVLSSSTNQLDDIKDSIRTAFLRIDQSLRDQNLNDVSGCTAVCALLSRTHIFIANCGDSRAVLFSKNDYMRFITEDHKPYHPLEKKRIIEAGGIATQRINGSLAVSRALGDFEFKKDMGRGPCEQLVSPEPEVTIVPRSASDKFLILACDGIWDVMSNYDVCKYVEYLLHIHHDVQDVCSSVIETCLRKGSKDNMSIIIVVFDKALKYSHEAHKIAKEMDKKIIAYMDEIMSDEDNLPRVGTYRHVLGEIQRLDREKEKCLLLPPGAGVEGKYDLLRDRFEENLKQISDLK